ncbi:hypothetical protein ACF1BB_27330 [Streptomyces griseoluteus]
MKLPKKAMVLLTTLLAGATLALCSDAAVAAPPQAATLASPSLSEIEWP